MPIKIEFQNVIMRLQNSICLSPRRRWRTVA